MPRKRQRAWTSVFFQEPSHHCDYIFSMDRTDFVLLLFNVFTSVAIVFANRILLDWCSFKYASCLTGLHLLVSGLFVRMYRGTPKKTEIPRAELVVFVLCSSISIVSLNLSLLLNSVTFYQISKLLIIPVTAVVELVLLHSVMSGWRIICSCCAVAGVAVVYVSMVMSVYSCCVWIYVYNKCTQICFYEKQILWILDA